MIALNQMAHSLRQAYLDIMNAPGAKSSCIPPDAILTADQMQVLMDESEATAEAAKQELLKLIAAIQSVREELSGLDLFLRQRGIVTRERAVRG